MQKKTLLLLLCSFSLLNSFAQKKLELKSEIESATIYLSGAEINRTASATLSTGNTDVVFTGLPASLNDQTINVKAEDKVLIMSVQFKFNYLEPNKLNAEIKKWTDSIEAINDELASIQNRKDALLLEQDLLEQNKKTQGTNSGLNFETLKQYHDYYVQKIADIKSELTAKGARQKKLEEIKMRISRQTAEFMNKRSAPSGEIWIQVQAPQSLSTKFYLSYLVPSAGWSPQYDVRCDKVNSPITLNYKASLWQSTGEDWKDIRLTLSTGNPITTASGPVFSTWFMNYYHGGYGALGEEADFNAFRGNVFYKADALKSSGWSGKSETFSKYTQVNESTLATTFEIKLPATIPSDSSAHQVNIGDFEVQAQYDYYALPRMDKDVFLNAHIADWEKLNLLDGPANIFFQGGYVGQSFISANQTKDTLDISLGRDKKVLLNREKLKDFTKEKFISSKYRQSVTYEIKVKNNESADIDLEVIEQVPISANSEIKITLDDAGGGVYKEETGKLSWKLKLQPGEEKQMRFSMTVEFPESKRVYAPRW